MNLSDNELLELHRLCGAFLDGTAGDSDRAALETWLRRSDDARELYVKLAGISASLCHYAGEMQLDAADAPRMRSGWLAFPGASLWFAGVALAACVALGFFWFLRPAPADETAPAQYVARLTGSKDCVWSGSTGRIALGEQVRGGRALDLQSGFAELTFDSGAQVVLHGPAALSVTSAWGGTLRRGSLRAYVPAEAIGFRISNPSVEVVDLGTEFTMSANESGSADVLVLKGEVEAAPRQTADQDTILLKARDGRRFGSSGVSPLPAGAVTLASLQEPVSLDRLSPSMHFVHWSFDEPRGGVLPGQAVGLGSIDCSLRLSDIPPSVAAETAEAGYAISLPAPARAGPRRRALHFDGRMYGQAEAPGLSGNAPRTIAFWVRVPANAPLTDSFAMAAWGATSKKFSARPVHIRWNRAPEDGPIGVLRTDFGGGYALGTTSLRDGRWHHVAVVFVPGDDGIPVQIHQYVDGKLESSSVNPPHRSTFLSSSKVETPTHLTDVLWLGCRLGTSGLKKDRFRGDLDELFVASWGLEPNEIVRLMRDNRIDPPSSPLALAAPAR